MISAKYSKFLSNVTSKSLKSSICEGNIVVMPKKYIDMLVYIDENLMSEDNLV